MLKLSSNVSDVFPKVLTLSWKVNESKPLMPGESYAGALSDLIPPSNRMAGHFYQMMYHGATQVGCHAAQCGSDVPGRGLYSR